MKMTPYPLSNYTLLCRLSCAIIQGFVTLSRYGYGDLNVHFPYKKRYSAINAISCVEEKNITNTEDRNKEIILFNLSEYRHQRPRADSGNEEKVEIGGKNSTKKCGEDK